MKIIWSDPVLTYVDYTKNIGKNLEKKGFSVFKERPQIISRILLKLKGVWLGFTLIVFSVNKKFIEPNIH